MNQVTKHMIERVSAILAQGEYITYDELVVELTEPYESVVKTIRELHAEARMIRRSRREEVDKTAMLTDINAHIANLISTQTLLENRLLGMYNALTREMSMDNLAREIDQLKKEVFGLSQIADDISDLNTTVERILDQRGIGQRTKDEN